MVKTNTNNNKKVVVKTNTNNNKKVVVKTNRVVVNKPNRPKIIVNRPTYNRPGYVWVEGHWKWNRFKRKYVWKKARWKKLKEITSGYLDIGILHLMVFIGLRVIGK